MIFDAVAYMLTNQISGLIRLTAGNDVFETWVDLGKYLTYRIPYEGRHLQYSTPIMKFRTPNFDFHLEFVIVRRLLRLNHKMSGPDSYYLWTVSRRALEENHDLLTFLAAAKRCEIEILPIIWLQDQSSSEAEGPRI
jgi:hypothetical protein